MTIRSQGDYKGDSFLLNAAYQTKIGKFTAFGYLLDFEPITGIAAGLNPVRDSTTTYGLRFAGEKPAGKIKLAYVASYATQTDYADNPLDFELDYLTGELTGTFRQFSLGIGTEILEGNGVVGVGGKGFTTPLATLHKFQGWADKFLTTPANGIEDLYATGSVTLKGVGSFDTLAWRSWRSPRSSSWRWYKGRSGSSLASSGWISYSGSASPACSH